MVSSTDIDLIDHQPAIIKVTKRSAYDSSLILGIALIVLFLGLFIFEFTRILTLTGRVNHTSPAQQLIESAGNPSRSS